MNFDRTPYRIGADFAQRDATNFALSYEFGEGVHCALDRGVRVNSSTLEEVEFLRASENLDAVLDARTYTLRTSVRQTVDVGAFDAEHNLVCVFGVLGEIVVKQMKRVSIGRTVDFAPTIIASA